MSGENTRTYRRMRQTRRILYTFRFATSNVLLTCVWLTGLGIGNGGKLRGEEKIEKGGKNLVFKFVLARSGAPISFFRIRTILPMPRPATLASIAYACMCAVRRRVVAVWIKRACLWGGRRKRTKSVGVCVCLRMERG